MTGPEPELEGFHSSRDDHIRQLGRPAWRLRGYGLRTGGDMTEPEAAIGIGCHAGETAL